MIDAHNSQIIITAERETGDSWHSLSFDKTRATCGCVAWCICQSSEAIYHIYQSLVVNRSSLASHTHRNPGMSNNERILGEDHILQCQEAFGVFDPDNKGLVATKDLGNLLRVLGINPTNEELQAGF